MAFHRFFLRSSSDNPRVKNELISHENEEIDGAPQRRPREDTFVVQASNPIIERKQHLKKASSGELSWRWLWFLNTSSGIQARSSKWFSRLRNHRARYDVWIVLFSVHPVPSSSFLSRWEAWSITSSHSPKYRVRVHWQAPFRLE